MEHLQPYDTDLQSALYSEPRNQKRYTVHRSVDDGWSSLSESIKDCVHSCWLGVEWSCSEMDCVCFNGCVILAVTQALTRPQHHLSTQHTSSRLKLLNIHYALSV